MEEDEDLERAMLSITPSKLQVQSKLLLLVFLFIFCNFTSTNSFIDNSICIG